MRIDIRRYLSRTINGQTGRDKLRHLGEEFVAEHPTGSRLFGAVLQMLSMSSTSGITDKGDRRIMLTAQHKYLMEWTNLTPRQIEVALTFLIEREGLLESTMVRMHGQTFMVIWLSDRAMHFLLKGSKLKKLRQWVFEPNADFLDTYRKVYDLTQMVNRTYRRHKPSVDPRGEAAPKVTPKATASGTAHVDPLIEEGSEGSEDKEGYEGETAKSSLPKSNSLSRGNQQKPNKSEEVDMGIIGAQTSKEVAEHFKKQDVIKDYCDGRPLTQVRQLQILWVALISRYHKADHNPKVLSSKDRAQLKLLKDKVGPTKIGPFLRRIVRNWSKYVSLVQKKSYKANKPAHPAIGYILQHLAVSDMVQDKLKVAGKSSGHSDMIAFVEKQREQEREYAKKKQK